MHFTQLTVTPHRIATLIRKDQVPVQITLELTISLVSLLFHLLLKNCIFYGNAVQFHNEFTKDYYYDKIV